MKSFVQGHVNITGLRVAEGIDAQEILGVLEENPYPGVPVNNGFGGIALTAEEVETGIGLTRGDPGVPHIYAQDDRPSVLLSRFLFDRHRFPRMGLPQNVIEDMEVEVLFELMGVDVFWVDGTDLVLVSSHDPVEVQRIVKPAVDSVLSDVGVDSGSVIPHPGHVPDPDLFLWLLYRLHENRQLSQNMRLSLIRTMNHQDGAAQNTRMLDSVAFDRSVLLTAIAEPGSVFGPAKLAVYESTVGLTVDFYLDGQGQVSAHVLRSYYDDDEVDVEANRAEFGVQLARDVSTVVIPGLLGAHQADVGWTEETKQGFLNWAREELNERFE